MTSQAETIRAANAWATAFGIVYSTIMREVASTSVTTSDVLEVAAKVATFLADQPAALDEDALVSGLASAMTGRITRHHDELLAAISPEGVDDYIAEMAWAPEASAKERDHTKAAIRMYAATVLDSLS